MELVKIFEDIDLFFNYKDLYQALGNTQWVSIYLASDQKSEVVPKFLLKLIVQNMMVVKVVFIEEAKLLIEIRSRMVFGGKMVYHNMRAFFP